MDKPSPNEIIKVLKEGNKRFYSNLSTHPHQAKMRLQLAGTEDQGDYAIATVIACSDSRVPVEILFDAGIMDLFVIRVAGNVCHVDECGSIEYGLTHVNTPVLVVLGHTQCGAVTTVAHALEGKVDKLAANIPLLINGIAPAVKRAKEAHKDVTGDAIIPHAIDENVWLGIEDLFMISATSRKLVAEKKVKVVGAIYDVGTGKIEWLPEEKTFEILKKVEASPDKATELFKKPKNK